MKSLRPISILLLVVLLLSSCKETGAPEAETAEQQATLPDSAAFVAQYHYWVDDNFLALDTLHLQTLAGHTDAEMADMELADSARQTALPNEQIVVAEVLNVVSDSVADWWIRVVSESNAQGWLSQQDFSLQLVPDSPISRFLHWIESRKGLISGIFLLFTLLWALTAWALRNRLGHLRTAYLFVPHVFSRPKTHRRVPRRDMYALWTCLLWILFLTACRILGWLRPAVCEAYYFHPSLNFFTASDMRISVCLLLGWLTLISFVCATIEIFRTQAWRRAFFQMLRFVWILAFIYLTLQFFSHIVLTLLMAVVLFGYLIWRMRSLWQLRYICGYCGREISHLGECPHCGRWNV